MTKIPIAEESQPGPTPDPTTGGLQPISNTPKETISVAAAGMKFIEAIVASWLPATCPLTGERVFDDAVLHSSQLDAINLDASGVDDDGIGSIFEYGGPLADLVRQAKFHPDESAARVLTTLWAKEAAQHVQSRGFEANAISYVPAHWRRRAARGFDLPALLASGLSKAMSVPLFTASPVRVLWTLSPPARAVPNGPKSTWTVLLSTPRPRPK